MTTIHITANSRLSADIKQQAILQNAAVNEQVNSQAKNPPKKPADNSALQVVETPKAMTLAQWWQEWQSQAMLTFQLPHETLPAKVLSSFEAQWLFEECLREELKSQLVNNRAAKDTNGISSLDEHKIELINIPATAKQCYQAWSMLCEYLPEWQSSEFWQDNHQADETLLFKQVLQRYQQKCQARGWQDKAMFEQFLLNWLPQTGTEMLPKQFLLHGFDEFTPNMQRWIQKVHQMGVTVTSDNQVNEELSLIQSSDYDVNHEFELELQNLIEPLFVYAAQDQFDEVQQVSLWALNELKALSQTKPFSKIKLAIVAPDIADYKTLLTQALDETLFMQGFNSLSLAHSHSISGQQGSNTKLYNTSLGEPLLDAGLVDNAMTSFRLFLQPNKTIAYQEWSQWLTSAYTFGDSNQRQHADAEFRRLQWANVTWPSLLKTQSSQSVPKSLVNKLQNWQAFLESSTIDLNHKVGLSEFVETLFQLLDTIGWPGSRNLSSSEYQQKTAFENALTQFSSLSGLQTQQSYSQWLAVLQRFLSEQVHQSQSVGHQPIQIMGMLEAGGQSFDAMWILGLTDEAWPRMANPNPFIPVQLQRSTAMPRSDAARELRYAQQLSQRLVNSACRVFCSYPKQSGESVLLPSSIFPLISNNANSQNAKLKTQIWQRQSYQTLAETLLALKTDKKRVSWQEDSQGIPLQVGAYAPGGTGILQAQRKCPLMAYIDYRLGARYGLQQVEDSLQNTNQGTLVHRVLELLWQELKTQTKLFSLSDEELSKLIQNHVQQAFDELQSHLSEGIQKVEESRILELCMQWLELEKQRDAFAVTDTEKQQVIELAGIQFKVVIDRIDDVQGHKLIVDYKTGRASINDLLSEPIKAPQLAVYLFAMHNVDDSDNADNSIAGIGYGLLHSDDGVKLNVLVEDEAFLGGSMHKKYARTRALKVFAKMAEKEGSEYYETSWQDFLNHLKQQVLQLATQVQQGYAAMHFERPADLAYAEGYLALRIPEVLQQLAEQAADHASLLNEEFA